METTISVMYLTVRMRVKYHLFFLNDLAIIEVSDIYPSYEGERSF